MTAKNPTWIDGVAVSGQEMRLALGGLVTPGGSLLCRSGVRPGSDLAVSALGTPNMTVNVALGQAVVQGTEAGTQGAALLTNDGTVNLAIAAADATNARKDLIVARWYSETVSVGSRRFALEVVTGSPSASPVDPAIPANSIVLARVTVAAAAASIVSGAITDLRTFTTSSGGITPSKDGSDVAGQYVGQYRERLDNGSLERWNGTAWTLAACRGIVSRVRLTSDSAAIDNTETVIASLSAFTAEALRRYELLINSAFFGTQAADDFTIRIRDTNTSGTIRASGNLDVPATGSGGLNNWTLVDEEIGWAGLVTPVVTLQRTGGGGTLNARAGFYARILDIGA